nr:hypothetical protein [Herbaspirillum sp. ASV7]
MPLPPAPNRVAAASSNERYIKKETGMSGIIVVALEMGVVAIIALAIYMVVKK